MGILDPYVSNFQRNAMPQSPRPNSCWLDEPITGEQAMICLHFGDPPGRDRPLGQPVRAGDRRRGRPRDVYPAPLRAPDDRPAAGPPRRLRGPAQGAGGRSSVPWHGRPTPMLVRSYRRDSGNVIPRHADVRALRNERLRPREANPSTQLLATLLIHSSGLWCASTGTDGTRRTGTTASTGTAARKDACGGSRLRSNRSKADPASARVEKLRAWFAPTDGEDALWLWLPRCSW